MARAFITDATGLALSPEERAFFRDADPWGFIIFKRNVETREQLARLVGQMREAVGREAPVLIDQEGGRVQRLQPPHWPRYPTGAAYAAIYDRDRAQGLAAARLGARLIAYDLAEVGIDVDCLPLADVPVSEADPVIGDRAYGTTPDKVAAIGAAVAEGLLDGGVLPVLKHIPGHGRATADSHHKLPVVDTDRATLESSDFAAFRPLAKLPLGMTAHVVFSAIDALAPATTSVKMVQEVIRRSIGFDGLLMSDDLSMNALNGTLTERSEATLAAGCDILLHCNGTLDARREVGAAAPPLAGDAKRRADAALRAKRAPNGFDVAAARGELAGLMTGV
jgi:beta-N-acetylhexosaminidase